jgi:hypothetical protein
VWLSSDGENDVVCIPFPLHFMIFVTHNGDVSPQRKTVFLIKKLGTAIWWGLHLQLIVTNLESDEKGETYEKELLQTESENEGTAEQEEQTLLVLKISSKTRSICDGIRSASEIFG